MQFSTIASILAMATVAIAAPAPADIEARTGSNNPVCSVQSQQVCCNGLLACVVQVLGNCGGNSYCCETNAPAGALINVVALNCLKVL
ncbi:hypothetical protein HG530_005711 [Fusarium avenaceum]|nr:hypothetical protein HG530_005711 [Fusarium avenaceum]